MPDQIKQERWWAEAQEYLRDGGIGEVIGLTSVSHDAGAPKVQMDTDMAMALAMLANAALQARLVVK